MMFAVASSFVTRRGVVPAGCPAPLMSLLDERSRVHRFLPLLRCAGHPTGTTSTHRDMPLVLACHQGLQPGVMGTGRSEVKEEKWAQPISGDTNGARYPSLPARTDDTRLPFDRLRANGAWETNRDRETSNV